MADHERVVGHALFEHVDARTGSRRFAYRGDTVHLGDAELARGEKFGVFTDPALIRPAAVATVVETVAVVTEVPLADAELTLDGDEAPVVTEAAEVVIGAVRPKPTAPTGEWRAYAVERGMDPDKAAAAARPELIQAYPA